MKICPRCQKTYTDENLNFCLEDGSVLEQAASGQLPETVLLNQPRITVPVQGGQSQQMPNQYVQQPAWNTAQPQYATPPKKSSKTWIWVVLILGVLALTCGGGVVGFIFFAASQAEVANKPTNVKGTPTPSTNTKTTNSGSNSSPGPDRNDVTKLDLKTWIQKDQSFGTTEMSGDELIMASRQSGYYYVLAGSKDQITAKANTIITVRNVNSSDTTLGYGIVFNSNPTPLQQGYAFLINSTTQKYRIVHHSPKKEEAVVNWTRSDAIRSGSDPNTLEVHDLADKVEFYINGKLVNSIRNTYGYPNGVLGLYAADAIKVGFKDLEIHK